MPTNAFMGDLFLFIGGAGCGALFILGVWGWVTLDQLQKALRRKP